MPAAKGSARTPLGPMLEEWWAMTRWVTKYIDENSERWALEKKDREESSKKWLEDWAKKSRFDKIRAIKDVALEENKPRIVTRIRPQKLVLRAKKTEKFGTSSQT